MRDLNTARVFASAILVLSALTACSPPDRPAPPEPRSLESAILAMRTGDVARLRSDLGKGKGLARRASGLSERLDPEA